MASKLRLITDLYGETLTQISNNPDEWMSFLECAAMNYKYPFNDQVLIYAQRPQAVACAKIEAWNKQVGRWVNRGAKGIALLSEDNGYTNLRYVFDIADTNSKFGKSFRLWSVTKPYEQDIIESLENKILSIKNDSERNYYINISIKQNLSVRQLRNKIKNNEYGRLEYKEDIGIISETKEITIKDMIKDPILISIDKNIDKLSEKALKQFIIEKLEEFLLECQQLLIEKVLEKFQISLLQKKN